MTGRLAGLLLVCVAVSARDVRVKVHGRGVVTMDGTDYLTGVLMGEASTFSSPEALKAMAVAARTWAFRHAGRHSSEGYDFCETTHCQDLRLNAGMATAVRTAVEATDGEMLWYEGKPAATYYHRHCGGATASGREVWPELYAPYLRSEPDTFCAARKIAEWSAELPVNAHLVSRTASGRVAEVSLHGRKVTAERFASRIGESFGWNLLRSNRYTLTRISANIVRASGNGYGHGVGLCQTGAEERGRAGHHYEAILAAYYPGTALGVSASGLRWRTAAGERVRVFAVEEPTLQELIPVADRALMEAERITGFRASMKPSVRSYPSLSIYRDATGDSGSVAATTSGSLIRMQPAGLLRSRGVLQSTMLHEMLHVLIEAKAHPSLPAWFREELVRHLSGARSALSPKYDSATMLGWVRTGLPPSAGQPSDARALQNRETMRAR